MRLLFVLVGLAAGLASCRPARPVAQGTPPAQTQALVRAWRHSQEEDQGAVQVYRPATYPFPPARGREGLTFEPNGRLTKLAIAPTDGLLPLPGRWTWDSAHVLHLLVEDQPPQDYRLQVLTLTPELLKVSVLAPR